MHTAAAAARRAVRARMPVLLYHANVVLFSRM